MQGQTFLCREEAQRIRENYPVGTRIELFLMKGDPYPAKPGSKGTVTCVDDAGHIHINWDHGSSLALIPEIDEFRIIHK
ncbi:hypothetical protein M2146_002576 [Lachnospiraceae bacterium PF1-22]